VTAGPRGRTLPCTAPDPRVTSAKTVPVWRRCLPVRRGNPRYPEYHVLPGDPSPPRESGLESELARRTFRTVDSPKNVPGIPADSGGGPMMKTGIHDARGENGAWAMLMLVMCSAYVNCLISLLGSDSGRFGCFFWVMDG